MEKQAVNHEENANKSARLPAWRVALLLVSGILIGGGAILPGISGGVLCVMFGIYRPMMEVLSNPVTGIRKHWRIFLPVGIGWVIGFLLLARLVELVFNANATVATWLFIGLIAGEIPALLRDAGEQGRTKGSIAACAVAFLLMLGALLAVRLSPTVSVTPSTGWYLFAGVLWGLSMIVPGMSSSPVLMALSLYAPLAAGIAAVDLGVILHWIGGLVLTVLLLARFVSRQMERHYSVTMHAVAGIAIASTVMTIPTDYPDAKTVLLSALCAAAGILIALGMSRLERLKDREEEG